jgi:uncharacterized integral membrane protein
MLIPLLVGVLLGAVSVIFALQNMVVITVSFFTWEIEGSLALILMLCGAMGILIALLIVLPETLKNYFKYRRLKKENERLEEELRKQKERTVFAKSVPPTPEELATIERGAADPSSA